MTERGLSEPSSGSYLQEGMGLLGGSHGSSGGVPIVGVQASSLSWHLNGTPSTCDVHSRLPGTLSTMCHPLSQVPGTGD